MLCKYINVKLKLKMVKEIQIVAFVELWEQVELVCGQSASLTDAFLLQLHLSSTISKVNPLAFWWSLMILNILHGPLWHDLLRFCIYNPVKRMSYKKMIANQVDSERFKLYTCFLWLSAFRKSDQRFSQLLHLRSDLSFLLSSLFSLLNLSFLLLCVFLCHFAWT